MTDYILQVLASNELSIEDSPLPEEVIKGIEDILALNGLTPQSLTIYREPQTIDIENSSGLTRIYSPFLLIAAKVFEGVLAQKMDPESDKWDPAFCTGEPWVELVELVKSMAKDAERR